MADGGGGAVRACMRGRSGAWVGRRPGGWQWQHLRAHSSCVHHTAPPPLARTPHHHHNRRHHHHHHHCPAMVLHTGHSTRDDSGVMAGCGLPAPSNHHELVRPNG